MSMKFSGFPGRIAGRIMYSDPAEARTECGVDEEDAHC
eukprot:SAG31_NODE_7_length_42755_cov_130.245728_35_plen_38_part_00